MLTTRQFFILLIVAILSAMLSAFLAISIVYKNLPLGILSIVLFLSLFYSAVFVCKISGIKSRSGDAKIEGEILPEFKK